MRQELDDDSRNALVRYRIERALSTIDEAVHDASAGFYNAAVNRLYYSCYYAATALLVANKIQANTHGGVKSMLHLNFAAQGKLDREHAKTFSMLMESRQSGDYADFVYFDEEDYNRLYPRAVAFIEAIKNLI